MVVPVGLEIKSWKRMFFTLAILLVLIWLEKSGYDNHNVLMLLAVLALILFFASIRLPKWLR